MTEKKYLGQSKRTNLLDIDSHASIPESTHILDWVDVSFKVPDPVKKGSTKTILHPMSGTAKSGRILAIMGASGAGKTSFLNILSGHTNRKDRKFTKGSILLNSQKMAPNDLNFAFVEQEDILMSTDTPQEAIEFSANLRLPKNESPKCKARRIRSVTTLLGLDKCKNTRIGCQRLKGISGGEKRRVSIGVEIISDPAIVFLDEPTSGLDFVTALSVIKTMRRLARSGKIVIATIHQPSSEIFHLFDDLLLLHGGKIAYHGTVLAAEEHFKTSGFECPLHYNPSDHYLSVLHDPSKAPKVVALTTERRNAEAGSPEVIIHEAKNLPTVLESEGPTPGVWTQMRLLISREVRSYVRDPWHILTHIGIALFMGTLLGCLCKGAGAKDAELSTAKGSLFLYQECLFTGLDTMLFKGIFGRSMFHREHRVGTYTIFSYVMSMVVVSIPMCAMYSLCELSPYLFLVGWQGSYLLIYLMFFLTHMNGAVFGLLIGFVAGRADLAAAAIPLVIVPQIYLAGMFRPTKTIPVALRWIQWISALKYGYSAFMIIEFGDDENHFKHAPNLDEDDIAHFKAMHFEQNYINPERPWDDYLFYTMMPLVMYVCLIALAMLVLKINALRR